VGATAAAAAVATRMPLTEVVGNGILRLYYYYYYYKTRTRIHDDHGIVIYESSHRDSRARIFSLKNFYRL